MVKTIRSSLGGGKLSEEEVLNLESNQQNIIHLKDVIQKQNMFPCNSLTKYLKVEIYIL